MFATRTHLNRTELGDKAKQIGSRLRPSSFKPVFIGLGIVLSLASLAVLFMAVLGKSQNGSD
jgi:hypothetical protein